MKRLLSALAAVVLLFGLGALAALALPRADAPASVVPVALAAAPDALPEAIGPRYNPIALPLDPTASISPFNAQGLLNYIGASALQVANLNANSQALDFWDRSLGFGIVNGVPIFDPALYPLQVGHPYLVQIDSSLPAGTPFTIVGDVPDIGAIHFTLVGATPCKYNEIMVPLDQYDQGISNGVELANAIGNVAIVASLNATNQNLDFWDLGLGFGIVNGVPIFAPGDFPVKLGYPYFVCVNVAGNNDVWP